MCTLFPYNAIISCVDYFDALYPGEDYIESKIAAACTVSLFATATLLLPFIIVNPKQQDYGMKSTDTDTDDDTPSTSAYSYTLSSSLKSPIFRTATGFALIVAILTSFAIVQKPTENMTLFLTYLVGSADSIAQTGLYVLAANVNIRCSAAVTLGSALSGFAVSVLRIITKALFDDNDERSVHVFFGFSAVFGSVCLVALWLVTREDVAMRHALDHGLCVMETANDSGKQIYSPANVSDFNAMRDLVCDKDCADCSQGGTGRSLSKVVEIGNVSESDHIFPTGTKQPDFGSIEILHSNLLDDKYFNIDADECGNLTLYLQTLQVTWKPTLMLFLMFFVTLSLFPGVMSEIQSSNGLGSWFPILNITIFNLFDCFGRIFAGSESFAAYLPRPNGPRIYSNSQSGKLLGNELKAFWEFIGIPCLARVLFYPLFIYSDELIRYDALVYILNAVFAFTNGYIACLCFMLGPTMPINQAHKDAASILLLLACDGGLVTGAVFGTFLHTK